jgi:hypothetical protein
VAGLYGEAVVRQGLRLSNADLTTDAPGGFRSLQGDYTRLGLGDDQRG